MDAIITMQAYRLDAVLISDGVGGAAPAITAAGGARGAAASMVACVVATGVRVEDNFRVRGRVRVRVINGERGSEGRIDG